MQGTTAKHSLGGACMTDLAIKRNGSSLSNLRKREAWQARCMLAAGVAVFLVPALIGRMTGWRWRPWPAGPEGNMPVLAEAKFAVNTYIPFVFMGW